MGKPVGGWCRRCKPANSRFRGARERAISTVRFEDGDLQTTARPAFLISALKKGGGGERDGPEQRSAMGFYVNPAVTT